MLPKMWETVFGACENPVVRNCHHSHGLTNASGLTAIPYISSWLEPKNSTSTRYRMMLIATSLVTIDCGAPSRKPGWFSSR